MNLLFPYRTLRQRCEAVLDELALPRSDSVHQLCRHVARRRGRPIHLHPLPAEGRVGGACGAWLATDTHDHVFFELGTTRPHQDHIILHEISHMLLDHQHPVTDETSPARAVLPDLDPQLIRRLLRRAAHTTRQEQDAEMLASLILSKTLHRARHSTHGTTQALERAFGLHVLGDR
ncbi:hypothetical protein OH797_01225 [Streptomyces anulatus]|uniref:hypothetical protein n=1 Tax=Streptomyces TaxID=1883 RepID=UPI0006D96055|nr:MULTISPECIES: hypothetical protein [Streptomyces]KPL30464.1 hypothetical protein JI76_36460 [Streptomyces anulatus]KQX30456.1 hypothetical protein ASD29_16495 [Streptomyces sp. Root1295]KRA40387.1 hypothetical protein ASD97_11315 [Streptomyces sp. Root63]MBT1099982.1 hypothetical protein [Streptomyces sp. Tu10]OKI78152.1 hypothetical protein AMK12_19490 [Streptomyces sp. TSRI0395]